MVDIEFESTMEDIEEICLILQTEDIKQEGHHDFIITIDDEDNNSCSSSTKQFVIEESEEVHEKQSHPSIGTSRQDFLNRLVQIRKCFLCTADVLPTSLQPHFVLKHLKKSFKLSDKLVVVCKLGCKKFPHYHCPEIDCLFSCMYKQNLRDHHSTHSTRNKRSDALKTEIEDLAEVMDIVPQSKKIANFLEMPSDKVSIALSKEELLNRLEIPFCFLCDDLVEFPSISQLKKHFSMLHIKKAAQICAYLILPCRLGCEGISALHYHCPQRSCRFCFPDKQSLHIHFNKHIDTADKMANFRESVNSKVNLVNHMRRLNIPSPKKSFDLDGVSYSPCESVGRNAIEMYDRLCLPYCYICSEGQFFNHMSGLERHFKNAHMNHSVDCGGCYVVLCALDCFKESKIRRHYHCPYCDMKDVRRSSLYVHLEYHRKHFIQANVIDNKMKNNKIVSSGTSDENNPSEPEVLLSLSSGLAYSEKKMHKSDETETWNETYEGIPVKKYLSVVVDESSVLSKAELPHCFLCNDDKDFITKSRLLAHMQRVHLNSHLKMGHIMVLLCKKYCGEKHQDRGHYHCLFCDFNGRQKERVHTHMQKHVSTLSRRSTTAEYYFPEALMQDLTVPDDWILEENREEVRHWEQSFNSYVADIYCAKAKTNNNVLDLRKKCIIYNHVKLKMKVEDKSLKYWVKFRGIKVVSCRQLSLENVLVLPLTKYNNDELNRVTDVQPKPGEEGADIVLTSSNHAEEFFKSFRLIPIREEFFKILYQLHLMHGYHPSPKVMFGEIRRKYIFFPRVLVDKFVSMCPTCGVHYPVSSHKSKYVSVQSGDNTNLAGVQVTILDMSAHPDGSYNYIIECFDRCSRLTWLYPAEKAVAEDLAESIIRSVFSITGLPAYIITNFTLEFLQEMLQEVQKRWSGECEQLIERSKEAAESLQMLSSNELMAGLKQLLLTQPSSWASALPHLQFRLNHTRGYNNSDNSSFEVVFGKQRSRPNWQKFLSSSTTQQVSSCVLEGGPGGEDEEGGTHNLIMELVHEADFEL